MFTGAGVNILFIDSPGDITHPDLVGKHVVNGSTTMCQTQGVNGNHGLVCATLAVAAANNSACGVGVAYDATFSQGYMDDWGERYTAGVDNGLVHVHSNSWGYETCFEYVGDEAIGEAVLNFPFADSCQFEGSSASSPCFSCPFDGSNYSMDEFVSCYTSIRSYCTFAGIYDVACADHWDLFVHCSRNALESADVIALQHGVTSGRGGKGIVYVASSGNSNYLGERPNMKGMQNSIYTMSVAATDGTDTHAHYSERGPANFISAPGGEPSTGAFMVAARSGDACGFIGKGTSYACPLVSGVAALMLQANPDLGWRDVQHIVAHTARKVDVDDSSWVTNGVGLSHSDKYGFGIVDAGAATQMAQAWTSANSTQWCVHSRTVDSNLAIPMEVEGTCSVIVAAS